MKSSESVIVTFMAVQRQVPVREVEKVDWGSVGGLPV